MHLRSSVVVGIVAVAAVAAAVRGLRAPAPRASLAAFAPSSSPVASTASLAQAVPTAETVEAGRPRRPAATRVPTVVVYVAGEVVRAGVYTLPATARAADALHAAGGPTAAADLVAVNLAERLVDGEEVAVVARGAASGAAPGHRTRRHGTARGASSGPARHRAKRKRRRRVPAPPSAAGGGDASSDATSEPPAIVDLNTADENELETLPGIGAALAARIVTVREASGPFASPDDLLDVGGMTQSKLDALLPYVTVR